MSPHPATVLKSATVAEARNLFGQNGFTIAPVVNDDGSLAGVITATDLLTKESSDTTPVSALMTEEVATVGNRSEVAEAARLLSDRALHHLVVTGDANAPIGIVSGVDIVKAIADSGLDHAVRELPGELLVFVPSDANVGEVRRQLQDAGITSAPVIDATGSVVGALTQLSLLDASDSDGHVSDIMDRHVLTVTDTETLGNVANLMAREGARRVFVSDKSGDVVGVITPTDLVRYYAGLYEGTGVD